MCRPQDEVIVFHIADPDVGSKFGTGVVGSAASVRTKAQEELARKADAVKSVDTKELQTTVEALTLPNGKTWKESVSSNVTQRNKTCVLTLVLTCHHVCGGGR